MVDVNQPSFSRGEITPEMFGRNDTASYFSALATARNVEVMQRGGIRNRSGLKFLAPTFKHDKKARLIPFVFGGADTHVLEFGDGYIRVMREDAHIIETAVNVSGVTQADPGVVTTSSAHGYSTGDEVFVSGVSGMEEVNFRRFKINVLTSTTFELLDQVDGLDFDTTVFSSYTSGGEVSKILTIDSPYSEDELFEIKFTQSFDVVFLVHPNHPPKQLKRLALDNWVLEDTEFFPTQKPPGSVLASASSTGTATLSYAVTAVSSNNDEESLPGLEGGSAFSISGITKADPAVVTLSSSTSILRTGHQIQINNVAGMTDVNGRRFTITRLSGTQFELQGIDSTNFSTYTSGGDLWPAFVTITNSNGTGSSVDNNISWSPVEGALKYVVYREEKGVFGFLGETSDVTFNDDGTLKPDVSDAVPFFRDPFFGPGNAPAAIGEHEQRVIMGGSDNSPGAFDVSQTGAFNNFSRSSPLKETDSFRATIAARSRGRIEHFVSLNDLVVMTENAVKRVTPGERSFAFSNISVKGLDDGEGASKVAPLLIGGKALFESSGGGKLFSTEFSFAIDGLQKEDVSLFSPHLLKEDKIVDRAYTPTPEPIIHMVMGTGRVLSLTYNPEEEVNVTGWCRWDTKGFFNSVISLRASTSENEESAYFIIERKINGRKVQLIEKLQNRSDRSRVQDYFFVDSGLSFQDPKAITNISNNTPAVVTSNSHGLSNGDEVELSGIVWESSQDSFGNEIFPEDLNDLRFVVKNVTTNTFTLELNGSSVDGAGLPKYDSGGKAYRLVTQLEGFEHLVGQKVTALLDGNVENGLTINSLGQVSLPRKTAVAHIGIPFVSEVKTLPVVDESSGVFSGRVKAVKNIMLRLKDSRGVLIGPEPFKLREWAQRKFENYGEPTNLFSGVLSLLPQGDLNRNGQTIVRQKDPLPMTLLEIISDVK